MKRFIELFGDLQPLKNEPQLTKKLEEYIKAKEAKSESTSAVTKEIETNYFEESTQPTNEINSDEYLSKFSNDYNYDLENSSSFSISFSFYVIFISLILSLILLLWCNILG